VKTGTSVPANDRAPSGAHTGSGMPLFYRQPVVLSAPLHSELSLAPTENYAFARDTNSIPLALNEFDFACRHYPIVFTASKPTIPVAITGIEKDRNLFVDEQGHWREGVYIPAYVRRYPFILLEDAKKKTFTLGIDAAADRIIKTPVRENKLFWRGEPTEVTRRAVTVCMEYQASSTMARAFCDELEDEGLLVDKEAGFDLTSGRKFRLTGFRIIDESRFEKMPGKAFLRFHRRHWLRPIYLQLISAANWASLLDIAAEPSG
jgi:SapC